MKHEIEHIEREEKIIASEQMELTEAIDVGNKGNEGKNHRLRYLILAIGILIFCLLIVLGILVVFEGRQLINSIHYELNTAPIETESVDDLLALPDVRPEQTQIFKQQMIAETKIRHILLIGTDSRATNENGRADAIILLSLNEKTGKIHLSSLMRAIYVSIPNDPDPEASSYWRPNSTLNAAHTWGGPRLLLKTVQRNFRIHVTDYIEVDFSSFRNVVDLLGGVPVQLTAEEASYLNNPALCGEGEERALMPGLQRLNGGEALDYARLRSIDSDFTRTGRQRHLIESIFQETKNLRVRDLLQLAKQIFPQIKTNLKREEIFELIFNTPKYARYPIDQLLIPLETTEAKTFVVKIEVYDIHWDENVRALREFIDG